MIWLEERRQRRSTDRVTALRYQLEHARSLGGIEAMVLADDAGIVLAAAGDSLVCEELGAFAPLLSRSVMGLPMPPLLRGADVHVRRLSHHGQPLFLACAGGGAARNAVVSHSARGVHRILCFN
jgi:hypothetical protein